MPVLKECRVNINSVLKLGKDGLFCTSRIFIILNFILCGHAVVDWMSPQFPTLYTQRAIDVSSV